MWEGRVRTKQLELTSNVGVISKLSGNKEGGGRTVGKHKRKFIYLGMGSNSNKHNRQPNGVSIYINGPLPQRHPPTPITVRGSSVRIMPAQDAQRGRTLPQNRATEPGAMRSIINDGPVPFFIAILSECLLLLQVTSTTLMRKD